MPFCPRCGASTTPEMAFCTSCGEGLARTMYAPQAAGPSLTPPPPPFPQAARGPRGPPGETREPAMVIILAIVTLGIYGLYYWWVASREMDAYAQRPGHSHKLVRIGTIVSVVSIVLLILAIASFVGSLIGKGIASGSEPPEAEIVGAVFGAIGLFLLFGAASFTGAILRLIGKYRMWEMLEADARQRAHPSPLSAGLMVALTVIGWVISPLGSILALIVMYMTQDHANQAWASAPR